MSRYDFWEKNGCAKLSKLMKHPLYKECLKPDIQSGNVFPAIRSRKVDFYNKGQKLFSFNGDKFKSNVAYLAAFESRPKDEITEEQFRNLRVCDSFKNGYSQIKSNLALHEQPESGGVFKLCQKFSCFKNAKSPEIGVLDIELSLESQDTKGSQDRIDLVLFHCDLQQLRYFEVKTFDNSEIWPRGIDNAKVRSQIHRYTNQLKKRQKTLLENYQQYVRLMNNLCNVSLPEPSCIDTEVDLLLIGFNSQQTTTIRDVLIPAFNDGFRCCCIGNTEGTSKNTLKKWWKNRESTQ